MPKGRGFRGENPVSRHTIPGRKPNHRVVVGWDPPLVTFFVQIIDPTLPDEEQVIHWVGADYPGQISTLVKLMDAMIPYAKMPPPILAQLLYDRERDA